MTGPLRGNSVVLEVSLRHLPQELPVKPEAILVVSGHSEENDFAVMASPTPPMVYDFGGFPKELYQIRYSAPGLPELARQAHSLVQGAGLLTHLNPKCGFDHGTYSLLAVTHPEAHLQLGRALAPLRDEGITDRRKRQQLTQPRRHDEEWGRRRRKARVGAIRFVA